jgi:cell pole-organizing protein PopZ
MRNFQMALMFGVILIGLGSIGCEMKPAPTPPANAGHGHDHDHDHEHPTTLADAIKQVDTFKATIKAAFGNKKPEDAHDALHEVAHALEAAEPLALAAATTDDAKSAAKSAIKDLFDAFGAMDDVLHGKEGKSYEDVSAKIDAALTVLQGLVKP